MPIRPLTNAPGGWGGQVCGVRQPVQRASGNGASTRSLRGRHSDVQPVPCREISPERILALAVLDPDPLG